MASQKGYKVEKDDEGLTAVDRELLARLDRGEKRGQIITEMNISRPRYYQITSRLREHGKKVPIAKRAPRKPASE